MRAIAFNWHGYMQFVADVPRKWMFVAVGILCLSFGGTPLLAEIVTTEVTIKSINTKQRTIFVTKQDGKDLELEFNSTTKVLMGDNAIKVDDLQDDQPNNKQENEHYLMHVIRVKSWSDQPDKSLQHKACFVCEWDAPAVK